MRALSGRIISERFSNSRAGIVSVEQWLVKSGLVNDTRVAHSCVAIGAFAEADAYSSPAFQFAYEATSNTFVWGVGKLERLNPPHLPDRGFAVAMLPHCTKEHADTPKR